MYLRPANHVFVGLMIILLCITGCGKESGSHSATPSIDEFQTKVSNDISSRGGGSFKVLSVKKTDGQSSEAQGVKMYTLEFVVTVEFSTPCTYKTEGGIEIDQSANANSSSPNRMRAKPGERALVHGDLKFEMKESGWNIMNVKYKAMVPDLASMEVQEDNAEYKYAP